MNLIEIEPIPCLKDNYAYLISRADSADAYVVDPSEAEPIVTALHRRSLTLRGILATHHHADHVGGNAAFPGARLVAHPVTAGIVRSMAGRTGELGRLMPAYASELARLELRPPEPGINFRRALQEVRGEIDRANLLA